jgi:hypothetical protein
LKGTIFANSALSLSKWFYGIFLMSKKLEGISVRELHKQLEVTYATAWRMMHRILSVKPSPKIWKQGTSAVMQEYLRGAVRMTKQKVTASKT